MSLQNFTTEICFGEVWPETSGSESAGVGSKTVMARLDIMKYYEFLSHNKHVRPFWMSAATCCSGDSSGSAYYLNLESGIFDRDRQSPGPLAATGVWRWMVVLDRARQFQNPQGTMERGSPGTETWHICR